MGEWLDDQFHGEGIYIFPNNERYEGQMLYGEREGKGVHFYLDGRNYKG